MNKKSNTANTKLMAVLLLLSGIIFTQEKNFPEPQIDYNPRSYLCMRVWDKIEIDGLLDDYSWMVVPWSKKFVDIEGDLNPKPYKDTRVKMLWDDKYFYFGAELEEDHIWAKLKTHDAVIYLDNDFEIFVDPDADNHNYFELELNAFETIWDLVLRKPYRDDANVALNAYEMLGIKVAVNIDGTLNDPSDTDKKWTIEVAIPWSAFKEFSFVPVPPKEGDQWKVNFSRVQWETEVIDGRYVKKKFPGTNKVLPENNWVWSPQGIIAMHYPERWGLVQFSYSVAKNNIEEKIKFNPEDEARHALMQLYYKQRTYKMNNGSFTSDITKLDINNFELKEYNWPPKIQSTDNLFEATIYNKDKSKKLTLYHDGLIRLKETK